jgi:hypothetical protein
MKLMCCGRNAVNHFDSELGIEILAGKNVDIGIAGHIAEMTGDGRGLDQLHEGVSGRLGQMLSEMLEQRRDIGLHTHGLDKGFDEGGNVLRDCTRSLSPADMWMIKCLPHIVRSPDQRFDPRSA